MGASSYEQWYRHFLDNRDRAVSLPWQDPYRLSAGDLRVAGRSIQQFQLGEWARGRGLKRRAAACAELAADPPSPAPVRAAVLHTHL